MSISGITNTSNTQATWQAMMQQRKQDFSQLASALQGGDLASAQKAFASLQNSGGQGQSSNTNAISNNSTTSSNPIVDDFAALSTALKSGNLSDAQTAFAKLQADMQAKKAGHHHHHHGGTGSNVTNSSSPSTSSSTTVPDNSTISISA